MEKNKEGRDRLLGEVAECFFFSFSFSFYLFSLERRAEERRAELSQGYPAAAYFDSRIGWQV